jgi:hypothetical protein
MTAIIIISSTLIVGIVSALVPYIPKSWIEKHIAKQIDPNELNF